MKRTRHGQLFLLLVLILVLIVLLFSLLLLSLLLRSILSVLAKHRAICEAIPTIPPQRDALQF